MVSLADLESFNDIKLHLRLTWFFAEVLCVAWGWRGSIGPAWLRTQWPQPVVWRLGTSTEIILDHLYTIYTIMGWIQPVFLVLRGFFLSIQAHSWQVSSLCIGNARQRAGKTGYIGCSPKSCSKKCNTWANLAEIIYMNPTCIDLVEAAEQQSRGFPAEFAHLLVAWQQCE